MPTPAHHLLSSIAFANESWAWLAVIFAVLSLAILIFTYRNSPLRGGSKFFALFLKAAGLILLALALLEPVVLDRQPKKHSNDVVLLADNSAGMTIPLSTDSPAPSEALQTFLTSDDTAAPEALPDWLAGISDTFRVQPYLFDRGLRQVGNFSELNFEGKNSAMVSALKNIDSRFQQRALAATVLFTDGNATDLSQLSAYLESGEESGNKKAPVYAVLIGEPNPAANDLAIQNLNATTTQFEDAQVTLHLDIHAKGAFPDPVEVYVISEKGKEIATKPVIIPESDQTLPVRLRFSSVPPGISFLKVGIRQTASTPIKELTELNNTQHVTVNRGNGPFRILYVSGRPNWEYKFLRRALSLDSEIDLVGLIRIAKREPKFEWRGKPGESSNPLFRGFDKDIPEETQRYDQPVLIRLNTKSPEELRDGFPKSEEDLFSSYRAIVLDDVEAEFFTAEQQNLIDRFVAQRGGTVIMLGGQESFQEGGWNNTPIGRILPVYLDPVKSGAPALDAVFDLSREGWLEPWMRHRSDQEAENTRLAYMPPFFAINRIEAIKPGASILASVKDVENRLFPAIVTQRYGEGKTAAVPVADFWRWGMKDEEQQVELGKSWRQLMRWAVAEVPSRVEMTKEENLEGALPVTKVAVRVRDDAARPQDDANVVLKVVDIDGTETSLTAEPSLEDPGLFTAEYPSENSAGYRINATVLDGDRLEIGRDSVARALNPDADEFARLGPNPEPLRRIAEATGGKLLTMAEIGSLPDLLSQLETPIEEIRQRPLWHTPWLFLIALVCFLGEWALRRKQGIL
ncbi:hypothetical protein N9B73_12655 [Verrucomicrobiales bacterium]|jgi:uncharacterized membrane protein|nr:hypothetical protein [Verrucomicrobiales bacterium]